MVRFCGKIKSNYTESVFRLRNRQVAILMALFGAISVSIGLCLALIFQSKRDLLIFLIYGILLLIIIAVIFADKSNKSFNWNYDIIITETIIKVISNHQNGFVSEKPLKKIKKVVDYGGYYLLLISKWEVSQSIICQKDLLIEGSLEEFEKLFEGKIERKVKS